MQNIAIIFSTSINYLNQALAMHEMLTRFGMHDLAWVVPLENLDSCSYQSLRTCFGKRVTKVLNLPAKIKLSGNKLFLPTMIPKHRYYILIDTDILILRKNFFGQFTNQIDPRATLISETFTCADFLKKHPWQKARFDHFPAILGQPYLQTGAIGICYSTYCDIFRLIVKLIQGIRVQMGDLQIWNYIALQHPQLFRFIAPQHCLVLRPDGTGFSSKFHLPYITYDMGNLKYQGYLVDALHYTSSRGRVITIKEYENFMKQELCIEKDTINN